MTEQEVVELKTRLATLEKAVTAIGDTQAATLPGLAERLTQLTGQLDALTEFAAALIRTHPDKPAMHKALREIRELPGVKNAQYNDARQVGFDYIYSQLHSHL